MQKTKWALGFVMAVFGLLITTQFRVQQQVPTDPSRLRGQDLGVELQLTQDRLKTAESDRERIASELDKLKLAATSAPTAIDTTPLEMLAGTIPIKGPGVVVTLTEGTDPSVKQPVQDEDLWRVVNELLAAGAEGVAINGQRITALSGIRNVGQRVMIYQSMTAAPFEIAAVGDPAVMEAALKLRDGVSAALARFGIKMTVARNDSIRLPAFRSIPTFRYAKPTR